MTDIDLRHKQEEGVIFGKLFSAIYEFTDRTILRYFSDALPVPVLAFEKVRGSCRGEFVPIDGLGIKNRITIDPFQCKTGEDIAEVLAHELVHLWQFSNGKAPDRNYHNEEFHNRMGLYGILTSGRNGHHEGYIEGGQWEDWLKENHDLKLAEFKLPGEDEPPRRKLIRWRCPNCEFNFRSRQNKVKVICQMKSCDMPMERVD